MLQKVGCQNLDKKFRFSDLPCYCYTFVHYIYASIVQEIVTNKIYSIKAKISNIKICVKKNLEFLSSINLLHEQISNFIDIVNILLIMM